MKKSSLVPPRVSEKVVKKNVTFFAYPLPPYIDRQKKTHFFLYILYYLFFNYIRNCEHEVRTVEYIIKEPLRAKRGAELFLPFCNEKLEYFRWNFFRRGSPPLYYTQKNSTFFYYIVAAA